MSIQSLKKLALAIHHHRFYHAFDSRTGCYVASCMNERVADCYRQGGYRVIFLSGGR